MSRTRLHARVAWGAALAAVLAGMAWAVFTPFERFPHNGASLISETGALRFDGASIAWLAQPLAEQAGATPRELTIVLRVRTSERASERPTTLFAIDDGETNPWRMRLTQRGDSALLDWREDPGVAGARRRPRQLGAAGLLAPGSEHVVAVATGEGGTRVSVDGVVDPEVDSRSPALRARDGEALRIALGNDPSAVSGWTGDLLAVAIFDRALAAGELAEATAALRAPASLLASGELALPAHVAGVRRAVLSAAPAPSRADAVLNFAGFVPLGALLALAPFARRRRALRFGLALVACSALSLAIEVAQVGFPARVSSLYDWWFNTAGGSLGALVGALLAARSRRAAD